MIGVVGPDDTVALIERVAQEGGFAQLLVAAPYKTPEETPSLVRALLPVCPMILFSGRLPYRLALLAGFSQDTLDYIPHEGTDLFRTLALVALDSRRIGHIPRFSFDCIPESDVNEAYDELRLSDARYVIPLEQDDEATVIDVERIIAGHRSLLKAGAVERCATCIRSVFERLSAENLPVVRIDHSRAAVRQALLRAKLRHDLIQAEASQTAICVLAPRARAGAAPASGKRIAEAAQKLSALLDCRIIKSGEEVLLMTTRQSILQGMKPQPILRGAEHKMPLVMGVGVGPNAEQAELLARQAQQKANLSPTQWCHLDKTGIAFEMIDPQEAREDRQADLEIAQALQISPTVLRRLTAVFRDLDPNGFTAAELAQSYNVLPRSARRLLTLLKDRGFVDECGVRNRNGAGRPEVVYRIFLDRILLPNV